MLLTNVVAWWPGSTHDSFILRHSSVGHRLEAGTVCHGWILGRANYCGNPKTCNFLLVLNPFTDLACDKRWLLTPFPNPQSAEERTYNLHHNQARCGAHHRALEGRWLDSTGGTLSYKPEKVCTIVRACAVLHNVAQLKDVALPPDADRLGPNLDPYPQAFEPNTAAVHQHLDVMRIL